MLHQLNTENFQQMLSQFSTTELEGMIAKFPYFEQAHVLLAKKYQQENSPKFDQQLQLAALYIQDRELLYTLFNDRNMVASADELVTVNDVQQQKEDIIPQAVIQPEPVIETKQASIEIVEQKETIKPVETPPVSDDEALAHALAELKQSADALQQMSDEARNEGAIDTIEVISSPAEVEITEIAGVEEVVSTEEGPKVIEEEQVEAAKETAPQNLQVVEQITEEAEKSDVKDEPVTESFSRIAPHTFDEWLKAFNNKSVKKTDEIPVVEEVQAPDEELNQLYTANITVDYLHDLVKEETHYAKGLERFIEEQIQKHKHPEKDKKAAENELDTELITETMAKVYEMQKKYTLAIKAYETLTLKFPEKSSLFAARINFLKNIL